MPSTDKIDNKIDVAEYLKGELNSDVKYEYVDGAVYAMAGASEKHNLIAGNIFRELGNHLKKQNSVCKTFMSDMKVKIRDIMSCFFYPDVMVVCDDKDNDSQYYKNSPVIIVEVLSQSTRKNDSSTKMIHYFNIPTLQEYVLIEQDFCQIQVFRKIEHWNTTFYFLGDEITFKSINVTLSVEDIYYQVDNEEVIHFLKENE